MNTPEDLRAKEENIDNWPEYQHRRWQDEVVEEDVVSKKRKRTEEPDGYDKELSIPHYYPPTNIIPSWVPPLVLPLHIPIHPSLIKTIIWKDIGGLLNEGTVPSVVHDVLSHRK
jgi:hypothetical protein